MAGEDVETHRGEVARRIKRERERERERVLACVVR